MPRAPRVHVPNTIHHVMARGNGGEPIVVAPTDWQRILDVIGLVKGTSDFSLYAFGLMTNHFHLLLEIRNDPLSHIMHRIQTTWAKRFNLTYGRRGHVFQQRFKSLLCQSNDYFCWLLRYIHMNPVKANLCEQPEDWPWSSFRQYLGLSEGLADVDWPLSLFGSNREQAVTAFREFVMQGLSDERAPLELTDSRAETEEIERPGILRGGPLTIQEIASQAAASMGISIEALFSQSRAKANCAARRILTRRALASGHRTTDLARELRVSPAAITRMARVP